MSTSSVLLLVALVSAAVPLLALRLRPPSTPFGVIGGFALLGTTTFFSYGFLGRWYHLFLMETTHMAYLVIVVAIPALLLGWLALGKLRGEVSRPLLAGGVIGALLIAGGIWGTHIAPNRLHVDRMTIADSGDLERKAVAGLIAEQPDLVVVPGDLFQGYRSDIAAERDDFVALLAELVENVEVVAVVSGDHDQGPLLPAMVTESGAMFLDNRIENLVIAGQKVQLSGISVVPSARLDTITALGKETDVLSVLVSHRPGATYSFPPNTDVDLIIAGHTHGGQVYLPWITDRIWYSDVPPPISSGGLHELNGFQLYVSTGVGMERGGAPQLRFGVPPEVGIIDVIPTADPPNAG